MAIVSPDAKERLRNSAATFTAICFLAWACSTSNTGSIRKRFASRSYPRRASTSRIYPAAWLSLNVDDEIDGFPDLGFRVGERRLGVASNDKIGEPMEGLLRGIRMDCCQRTGVAGIEGIKQRPRFDSAHFAQNDSIRSPAQSRLQKIVERDASLERIGLAFNGEYVRLLDPKLGRILDHDDALLLRNRLSKNVEKRCLPGTGSAADKQRLAVRNLLAQIVRERRRKRAASDEVIDGITACW